jgi:DeoR family transcriptional regulator, suf operon transcriptional repressor
VLALLGETRGRILVMLCSRRLTANELAAELGVTSTAIRTHLAVLRDANLVRYATESRGVGKPTHVYELTTEGQYWLSSAYAPALDTLLRAARARLGRAADAMLREAGRQLANGNASRKTSVARGAQRCVEILRSFGGDAEAERREDEIVIRSHCCPLASIVKTAPDACKLFEGMARAVIGRDVVEQCERANTPQCVFVVRTD